MVDGISEESLPGEYQYGFHDDEHSTMRLEGLLTAEMVQKISSLKNEPAWMTQKRLKAFEQYQQKPMPNWGNPELISKIDFEKVIYFLRSIEEQGKTWDDIPDDIKNTFDKLGLPKAEQDWLGGISAQYESESVYHSIDEELEKLGVVFLDMDSGLREYPELVKEYFGKIVPASDNKFAALNTAVWSGGSFLYVPPGVEVPMPVQSYFRINAQNMGQFERTLLIVDEGAKVHYIEGCTAPAHSTNALHAAVVEIIAHPKAEIRYSTVQNWYTNVYNLVTKRAIAHEDATVEWIDGNIGSLLTQKYPAVILKGERSHAEVISVAWAGEGQHQDTGSKVIHLAPNSTSNILSKSISKKGGRASYRGLVKVAQNATGCKVNVRCDALILDEASRSDTYPTMEVSNNNCQVEHEATVSKVSGDQLFYLMSRGHTEEEAMALIVNGFFEPFNRELPHEFAAEMNKLLSLKMDGAIG